MSDLEQHARAIRQAVAELRRHGMQHVPASADERRALRAAEALEDAIMLTLPVIGMEPLVSRRWDGADDRD